VQKRERAEIVSCTIPGGEGGPGERGAETKTWEGMPKKPEKVRNVAHSQTVETEIIRWGMLKGDKNQKSRKSKDSFLVKDPTTSQSQKATNSSELPRTLEGSWRKLPQVPGSEKAERLKGKKKHSEKVH